MKITCIRAKLLNGLKTVAPAIGGRDALDILRNVRIEAEDGRLTPGAEEDELDTVGLTASDADLQIRAAVPAKVDGVGTVCLPGKFLTAFVDALPEGKVEIEVNDVGTRAKVSGGECRYTLVAESADGFPVMVEPHNGDGFGLNALLAREMLRKVEYAAAGESEGRRVLRGVNVCVNDKMIRMVATDGRRLSMVEHFFDRAGVKDVSLGTLPQTVVRELSSLLGRICAETEIRFTTDGKMIKVAAEKGEFEIVSRLYEDVYPNWTRVVPLKTAFTASVKRKAFLSELRRASVATVAGDGRKVKLTFEPRRVVMEGAADDISKSRTQMDVEYEGDKAQFVVNPRLVEDVLKSVDDEVVTIGFDGSDQRLVFKCGIPFVAVVQPMRI